MEANLKKYMKIQETLNEWKMLSISSDKLTTLQTACQIYKRKDGADLISKRSQPKLIIQTQQTHVPPTEPFSVPINSPSLTRNVSPIGRHNGGIAVTTLTTNQNIVAPNFEKSDAGGSQPR